MQIIMIKIKSHQRQVYKKGREQDKFQQALEGKETCLDALFVFPSHLHLACLSQLLAGPTKQLNCSKFLDH